MVNSLLPSIPKNLDMVLENITLAAQTGGRRSESVKLVVVTKGHSVDVVRAVIAAGASCLGENYIQDALPKIEAVADQEIEWHMIGHIQSRKARFVSEYFDWVHSVDSMKISRRLDKFANEHRRVLPVLLECNISHEATKFGWPAWNEKAWTKLADDLTPLFDLPNIEVRGLMAMPPFDPDPENSRPYFVKLRKLMDYLSAQFPNTSWKELSMGMSADYQVAVQEGATIVRVGTSIVGPRPH